MAGEYTVIPPPARFGRTPSSVRRPAPLAGQHTREVLAELGFTDAEITGLERDGVLRTRRGLEPAAIPAGPRRVRPAAEPGGSNAWIEGAGLVGVAACARRSGTTT